MIDENVFRTLPIGPINQLTKMIDGSTLVIRFAFATNGITLTKDEALRMGQVISDLYQCDFKHQYE